MDCNINVYARLKCDLYTHVYVEFPSMLVGVAMLRAVIY